MQCLHPIHIRLPTGEPQTVPCGKCISCQENHRKEWFFRLKSEQRGAKSSFIVTLTYDDANLPSLVEFRSKVFSEVEYLYSPYCIKDVQDFHKRLRKRISFRFFGVAEYGSRSLRPHYHIMYFFDTVHDIHFLMRTFLDAWKLGSQMTIDYLTDASINYCLKYILKNFDSRVNRPQPKIFCSKRPYIGSNFITDEKVSFFYSKACDNSDFVGFTQVLPRIYRDRFFDDDLKERVRESREEYRIEQLSKDRNFLDYEEARNRIVLKQQKSKF